MAKRIIKVEIGDTIEVAGAARFICTELFLSHTDHPYVIFEPPEALIEIKLEEDEDANG